MNKANLFVWKNIQVKKRTREISKVFHSYHPYDHKVGITLCLFQFVLIPPSNSPFNLVPRVSRVGRGETGNEIALPYCLDFVSFLSGVCRLTSVILLSFHISKVGERQTVLITEDAKDQAHFVGHNKFYDQVSHD